MSQTHQRRTLFLSDVHLGSVHCHAEQLAEFLAQARCDTLYLVGDIVDLWWMSKRKAAWSQAHQKVVESLYAMRKQGTEIIYVPGNHDRPIRKFCGLMLPAMQIRRRTIHETADGRRFLVVHGDDYDSITHFGNFKEKVGDWLYERLLSCNLLVNKIRGLFGMRYWSLAEYIKSQSASAEEFIDRFIQAGIDDAKIRGLDGIICGHIHRPALIERDGMIYANDGDWVESLTALTEHEDGTLELINHRFETLARIEARSNAKHADNKVVPLRKVA